MVVGRHMSVGRADGEGILSVLSGKLGYVMQLEWDVHWINIVEAGWQEYLLAESSLAEGEADESLGPAAYRTLRLGASAAIFLHHFAEVAVRARPDFLQETKFDLANIRQLVSQKCCMSRTDTPSADLALLEDVADSLKHAVLTRRVAQRRVQQNDQVLVIASGYAELPFGEGKYGGTDQVIVRAKTGHRALSGVLQNVSDAWLSTFGWELPGMGEPSAPP